MAERKPLVIIDGKVKELPPSDTIAASSFGYFQVLKSGTQATTATFTTLAGWATPTINVGGDITFNTTTGVITFVSEGVYSISVHAVGEGNNSNRCTLKLKLQQFNDPDFEDIEGAFDAQYASRSTAFPTGSAQFNNFFYSTTGGDDVQLQICDLGVPANINTDRARITINRIA